MQNIDIKSKYDALIEKGLVLTLNAKKNKLEINDNKGRKRDAEMIADDNQFDLAEMINYIKSLEEEKQGESTKRTLDYINLPVKPADLKSDSDLTGADLKIWEGLRFSSDPSKFYVKDKKDRETYTAFLTRSSISDTADAKTLKEAFYNSEYDPEQIAKQYLSTVKIKSWEDFNLEWQNLPITAWKYYQIQVLKNEDDKKDIQFNRLVVLRGTGDSLYKEFVNYEGQFRRKIGTFDQEPVNLTNDKNTPALAYIDLERLDRNYKGQTSKLWDDFLLQRLHNEDYVSIFKAWSYAVIVGRNNSRQEMWLYGNGGTGKSCLCKAFVNGLKKLAGKDICLAASKDTGKSHFNIELLNKHFIVYADAKNLKNGMSEFKHNVTGSDVMRLEGKGTNAVSGTIYLKCLTCSNELPKVDTTDRSQSSRMIVLPFSLTDEELKRYNLMDDKQQLIGSADFQSQLDNEFELYLASCREHYIKRCPSDSNIDAHEAKEYLESISTQEQDEVEEFIGDFFEISKRGIDEKGGSITLKDFRAHIIRGLELTDEYGNKIYKNVNINSVYTYLEKKYEFVKRNIRVTVDDKSLTPKGLISKTWKLTIKTEIFDKIYKNNYEDECDIFDDSTNNILVL